MTSAQDVIESYVADVGQRLPLGQRGDIARELHVLLNDTLQARAEREGRAADEAMARAVVAEFGDPTDIAAGYRTGGLLIISPEQSGAFIKAAIIGVAIQWAIGIAAAVARLRAGEPEAAVLQQWFFFWGLGALWWPGFIVVCATAVAWLKARGANRFIGGMKMTSSGSRIGGWVLMPIAAFFVVFYAAPTWFIAQIAPWMDTSWITYTDEFRMARLPALLLYMSGNVVHAALLAFKGHESRVSRQFAIAIGLAGVVIMTWCAIGGPIVVSPPSDELFRFLLGVMALIALFDLARRVSREMILAR